MGILSQLAKELEALINDAEKLPREEDGIDAVAWRYCRLLWQDKLQLEMVFQLTRIGNAMEMRNDMVREAFSAEPPREEEEEEEDDPVRDDFNALAREHNRRMYE